MQINMECAQRKNIICNQHGVGSKKEKDAKQDGVGSKEEHYMQIRIEWVQRKNITCKSARRGFK